MAETLDMTLDDIIKNNKKGNSSSGGGGSRRREGRRGSAANGSAGAASGVGPNRRAFKRSGNRAAPYQPPKAPESAWQHDKFADVPARGGAGGRVSAIETGTKLFITNLDFGVSSDDIKELFCELGDLKRCSIHFDRSGRSKGTAEVIFARRNDAVTAMRKYNNVQLDGKPMKIELLKTNTPTAQAALPARNVDRSAPRNASAGLAQSRPRARGGRGRRGGGAAGGSGSGGRRGKERSQPRSAEELDAELEKYHADATPMQT